MKIVSFGDVHMAIAQMAKIAVELATADLLILSGDLTHFGGPPEAQRVIEAARSYCPTVLALPGNVNHPNVIPFLQKEQIDLHGVQRRMQSLDLIGCGGSNLTPFRTPLEYHDEELGALLARAYPSLAAAAPRQLLVCHTPPHATRLDRLTTGAPVGSLAVRRVIEQRQPQLCITGHIHESPGIDFIGRTKILNPGPFAAGGYIVAWCDEKGIDAELKWIQ